MFEACLSSSGQPLSGLRAIELAGWIAGPFAGSIMGDFGAEVIKVERPGIGDPHRHVGIIDERDPDRSPWWIALARNKRGITLDISKEEGKGLFLDLVRHADVLVESSIPGSLERLGLGWAELSAVQQGLVMLRISGFGQSGPFHDRPGFDRAAQAFAGLMHLTGHPDSPPVRAGLPVMDYVTGMWGALGVLLALRARDSNGGLGQVVDQALYTATFPFLGDILWEVETLGRDRGRTGNAHEAVSPGGTYATADGRWLMISVNTDTAFRALVAALGLDGLESDPQFSTNRLRIENRAPLDRVINERISMLSESEITARLEAARVPFSPVHSVAQVADHPQVVARGDFIHMQDRLLGAIPTAAPQPRLTLNPGQVTSTGPTLGSDNEFVYCELLGLDRGRLAELMAAGVV